LEKTTEEKKVSAEMKEAIWNNPSFAEYCEYSSEAV
jgi:hypothetical protein